MTTLLSKESCSPLNSHKVRRKLPLLLLLIMANSFTFLAKASDASTASMLSNSISHLSAYEAQNYVKEYRSSLRECLKSKNNQLKESRETCRLESVEKIRAKTSEQFKQRIVRDRFNQLKMDGHISSYNNTPNANLPSVGVVGDSLVVGAMASESLEPHLALLIYKIFVDFLVLDSNPLPKNYVQLVEQIPETPSRVVRVYDSPEKHKTGLGRYFENKGSKYIDCEECSFAYKLARNLDIPGSNIFFGGQSGKRVDTVYEQMVRVSLPLDGLPDTVFVSYTANDICHPANAEFSYEEKYQEYLAKMVEQMTQALDKLKPANKQTNIYVVSSADVGNLLENEKVLSKEISHWFPGGPNKEQTTCKDMRNKTVGGAKELANMCPYILGTSLSDTQRIDQIKTLHRAVSDAQRDTVKVINDKGYENIKLVFLNSILDVDFDDKDISPDCFHPSSVGHGKIADALLREINEKQKEASQ